MSPIVTRICKWTISILAASILVHCTSLASPQTPNEKRVAGNSCELNRKTELAGRAANEQSSLGFKATGFTSFRNVELQADDQQEASRQLPEPDGQFATHDKPIKVYILLGQSNMLGFGRVGPAETQGTLEHLIKNQKKYQHLTDDDEKWTERKDVRYVHVMDKRGVDFHNLDEFSDVKNEWLTASGNFGPELGFGSVMGHLHDEPVLILKACIGNRSLGWDLLPPGSERFEFEGKTYAGYKDNPGSWVDGQPKKEVAWYAGRQYDADTSHAKIVLQNLAKYYPGYQDQGYEIAGFVFWQGHKDQNAAHASRYEQNLVHLIRTLRSDFEAPNAKFVLATIAFGGDELAGHGLTIANAQLAVSGETGKYPEFEGNVKTIDARPFWREKEASPSGQDYHYNHNAETYMEVGYALGWAMSELMK